MTISTIYQEFGRMKTNEQSDTLSDLHSQLADPKRLLSEKEKKALRKQIAALEKQAKPQPPIQLPLL